MRKINLTPGTKKFKLLAWMADRPVTRYSEIERFICEMSGYDYDKMETQKKYKEWRQVNGTYRVGTKQVRTHRGIWGTNLCSGNSAILHTYCERLYSNGKYIGWGVKPTIIAAIKAKMATPKSSLEQNLPSDEIPNNSKVVERKMIRILDMDKVQYWNPKASTVDKIMADLKPCPTREDILTAASLASVVNPLVALQEKYALLGKEYRALEAERDRIEKRMLDVMNERAQVKSEANSFFGE